MIWLLAGAAVVGWSVAVILLGALPARARRRAVQSALRLRSHVEPCLRRRLAEIDGSKVPTQTSAVQDPDEIIDVVCQLADRLTEHDRSQIVLGDTLNIAHSDTMPVDVSSLPPEGEDDRQK
jgi:hypothetical protein